MIFIYGKCPICGKLFKANTHGRPRKYCSDDCKWEDIKTKRKKERIIEQKCQYCGKIFIGNKDQIYCSDECRRQAEFQIRKENRIITQKCQYCGKTFKANKRKYCSLECYEKARRDITSKRNSYKWYNDIEFRKRQVLKYGGGLGTITLSENKNDDWEKELIRVRALKKQAGLRRA